MAYLGPIDFISNSLKISPMKIYKYSILTSFICIFLYGCTSKQTETTTSGKITIAADESFAPLIDSQLQTFIAQHKDVEIKPVYKPEEEAIDFFLKDSARLVFVTRELSPNEVSRLEKLKIFPKTSHVATDGIALIIHPDNPDSLLTELQIKNILEGKALSWNDISKKNNASEIIMVFDNNASSNLRFMNEHFKIKGKNAAKVYAAGNNKEVINYIKANKNAIGVIGANWISDKDDPKMLSFLNGIRVVGISKNPNPTSEEEYFQPYQAYMATKDYPLTRKLFVISREPKTGLGTGFSVFMRSDKGQKIVLKSGLYPANAPVRLIKVKKE
jgi:phosphate transport system substrate-binding protein